MKSQDAELHPLLSDMQKFIANRYPDGESMQTDNFLDELTHEYGCQDIGLKAERTVTQESEEYVKVEDLNDPDLKVQSNRNVVIHPKVYK